MLSDPRGAYRQLLRHPVFKKGALFLTLLFATAPASTLWAAGTTDNVKAHYLPEATAEQFGRLNILYNSRICPVQTVAIDFTKKLYGARSYKGLTAEQVFTGWIFWGEEWMNEPLLKIKDGEMKSTLQLPDYVSANNFFNNDMGGYTIGPYIKEYYEGNHDKFHTQVASVDDKIQLLMDLRRGLLLKIFPNTVKGNTIWYAPTENLPKTINAEHQRFIQTIFTLLYDEAEAENYKLMDEMIGKIQKYQVKNAGTSLPTAKQTEAERTYNRIPFATILFIECLTMGVLTFFYTIVRQSREGQLEQNLDTRAGQQSLLDTVVTASSRIIMLATLAALTYCEYLRWTISGTLPMSNGYETMLFVAWKVLLVALIFSLRFHLLLSCGFLMSGFFLLVSHISQMDPQITHIMPVLNSPLLSIHVSIIMIGFALLSLPLINGITAIIVRIINRDASTVTLGLQQLSLLLQYPA